MRGATVIIKDLNLVNRYFNPRAPCGARPSASQHGIPTEIISIHAPHAGRDSLVRRARRRRTDFNPRAPCGARPLWIGSAIRFSLFQSTRPMRGATILGSRYHTAMALFQSTRPMRGATRDIRTNSGSILFQSTRPMRGATTGHGLKITVGIFQSTRPMRGATSFLIAAWRALADFNPRAPCGARRYLRWPTTFI